MSSLTSVDKKLRKILRLDIVNFARLSRDICDADQQRTREAAKNVSCCGNKSSPKRSKSNYIYHENNLRRIGKNHNFHANDYYDHSKAIYNNNTRINTHHANDY